MNMERKMLYNFMIDSYISPTFKDVSKIYDFSFSSQIGFPECYKIQEDIKRNILDKITHFDIGYCDFIKEINIELESTIKYDKAIWFNDSIFHQLDKDVLSIKLTERDWKDEKTYGWFDYNIIRYSLYIAYYWHLKEHNANNDFVKFVEFLSRVDFNGADKYLSIEDYIKSLKETQHKEINEKLFYEAANSYAEMNSNKLIFNHRIE